MHRIAFIKLGLTLVATEAWLSGCADGGAGGQASGGAGAGAGNPNAGHGAVAGKAATSGAGGNSCTTDANLIQTSMESHDHLPLATPMTATQLTYSIQCV